MLVSIAVGVHLTPFRTQKLSPLAAMVLQIYCERVARCQLFFLTLFGFLLRTKEGFFYDVAVMNRLRFTFLLNKIEGRTGIKPFYLFLIVTVLQRDGFCFPPFVL